MKPSEQSWIILFGGARREKVLQALVEANVTIQAVIVPATASEALSNAIQTLKAQGFNIISTTKSALSETLRPFAGNPLLSIGFPYLLSREILTRHPLRLNMHPTLLPQYRGPTSGPYILMHGEKMSGSTVHLLEEEMDAGDIVAQREVPLDKFDTIRSLQRKVYACEPALICGALRNLDQGVKPMKQDATKASSFPKKRIPEDSEIDPNKSLLELFDTIRACDPEHYPAFFHINGQRVCIKLWRPDKTAEDGADTL